VFTELHPGCIGDALTFLNKIRVTLSCREPHQRIAKDTCPNTWESLEFNLGVGSIVQCLVPQLFMLVPSGADGYLVFASCDLDLTGEGSISKWHSIFLFFIFLVRCAKGTLPLLVKNVMCIHILSYLFMNIFGTISKGAINESA
jgi:hypothetical protein